MEELLLSFQTWIMREWLSGGCTELQMTGSDGNGRGRTVQLLHPHRR
jgi:hypothetical protein